MKDEYIIINKTVLLKRIEETEKEYFKVKGNDDADEHFLDGRRTSFKEVLSQSTPLIPEIEKSIEYGLLEGSGAELNEITDEVIEHQQAYISNLKLEIQFKTMKRLLWLDDYRDPFDKDQNWLVFSPITEPFEVFWVKDYSEFIQWIENNNLPDGICFDHDLGEQDERTGYDCAKWLVQYCYKTRNPVPAFNVQSANPVGKENIFQILRKYNRAYYGDSEMVFKNELVNKII